MYALFVLGVAVLGVIVAYELLLFALRIILTAFGLGRALINYRTEKPR